MPEHYRILVSPLDWGLGHASRLIPVIRSLVESGHQVWIGASGRPALLLTSAFPNLPIIPLPMTPVRYSPYPWLLAGVILQLPMFLFSCLRDYLRLHALIRAFNFQIVISDNRYGLFSKRVYSIMITHQLSPRLPKSFRWLEPLLNKLILLIVKQFDECWIPDSADAEKNLSGELTHRYPLPNNARFIGILSRFANTTIHKKPETATPEIFVVAAGPEPSCSRFSSKMARLCGEMNRQTLIAGGFGHPLSLDNMSVKIVSHLSDNEFFRNLKESQFLVCRSGYTTLMDLIAISRSALLIPTPGQPEQEYLAQHMKEKNWFNVLDECKLTPDWLMEQEQRFGPETMITGPPDIRFARNPIQSKKNTRVAQKPIKNPK